MHQARSDDAGAAMTPSPLRELAADIRPDDARSDVYAVSNAQLAAWAAKLESLAGEYAVVPREPSEEMIVAFCEAWFRKRRPIDDPEMEDAYRAMIEAAERQETGR